MVEAADAPRNAITGRLYTLDDRIRALRAGIEKDRAELRTLSDSADAAGAGDVARECHDDAKSEYRQHIIVQQAQLIELYERKLAELTTAHAAAVMSASEEDA